MSGWQFRKSAPSDNVMVPATSDPFESPKWAPPIWHMPEGLVLLVNLVRGLLRLVLFAVRHPIPVGIAGALAWLLYTFGWAPLAWLAGLASLTLAGWAALDWASFLRLVARPLRARWRHLVVYRRRWQPVMVMSGLAFYRNHREYLPTLQRVIVSATTDRLLVKMLSGQAPVIWEDHADNLAHGFGARICRVRTADKPGFVWLEFVRTDALAQPLAALPLPVHAGPVDLEYLAVGRCEDGTPYRLRLLGTHVLFAGATGAGKGSFFWSAIRALLPATKAGLVQLWGLDPKRMELAFGRRLFNRYSDDTDGGMVALLEDAVTLMQDRAARFGGRTRTFIPTLTDPFIVVFIDELAFLTAYCPHRDLKKRAEAAIATLTSQGRSVGVCVAGALQDPRKEVINLRNLFPDRIALRLDESDQADMVLGDGARDRGAYADLISPISRIGAGVAFVRLEGSPDPVRVRAAYVSDADIAEMVAYLGRDLTPIEGGEAA
jgi:S-DNA-T family DNA segregation ATPase FtsK/SpoIIIE